MTPNFNKLSYTDISSFLHNLPTISVDNFKLTDRAISSYLLEMDVDLHAYIIKMERVEAWTLDSRSDNGDMDRNEVQRIYTLITDYLKALCKYEITDEAYQQVFILLSALGVRRFLCAIKFLSDQQPELLQVVYAKSKINSKDVACLRSRLERIFLTSEIIRIYSGNSFEQIRKILTELQHESL